MKVRLNAAPLDVCDTVSFLKAPCNLSCIKVKCLITVATCLLLMSLQLRRVQELEHDPREPVLGITLTVDHATVSRIYTNESFDDS
jgi:hypothetical protein